MKEIKLINKDKKVLFFYKNVNNNIQKTLEEAVRLGVNLDGLEIKGEDLSYSFLTGIKIKDANLTKADLTLAYLTKADLTGADLFKADLTGADLFKADLTRSDLRGSILIDNDFFGSILDGVKVDENTVINKKTYNTIPNKYKHIFNVCNFVD